jgi:hypothetical protein
VRDRGSLVEDCESKREKVQTKWDIGATLYSPISVNIREGLIPIGLSAYQKILTIVADDTAHDRIG